MELYKVVSSDLQAMNGGDIDYTEYVENDSWTPRIDEVEKCERGYHVTPHPCIWMDSEDDRVFEVETDGLVEDDTVGVTEKLVCERIKFVEEVDVEIDENTNSGDLNSGSWNSGSQNSGNRNSGRRNSGDLNSGHGNSGHGNSGRLNSGSWNSGSWNSGHRNSGYRNSGYRNSGDRNSGSWNSGDRNSGRLNSGNRNSGSWNSGDWNSADGCSGHFNSEPPDQIRVFNQWIDRETWENADKPEFIYFDLLESGYEASWQQALDEAAPDDVQKLVELPGFDYTVFEEISGISQAEIQEKLERGER